MSIIITGSDGGIGRAIAKKVCLAGYYYYGLSKWNNLDVTDYEQVAEFFQGISETSVLINNAGTVEMGDVENLSPEDWQKQIDVNLTGMFYCCKEFIKKNKNKGGKIINIASTSAFGSRPGRSAYAASKAAVVSFSLSLAEEVKKYGIKVYCLAPEACDTPLRHKINPNDDFENMMKPGEVADFVLKIIQDGYMLDNQVVYLRRGHLANLDNLYE